MLSWLVHGVIYSKMLETFRRALVSEGFTNFEELPVESDLRSCTGFASMLDVTWADAMKIDKELALATGALLDTCWQRGPLPNFKRGKSECMLCFKGPGNPLHFTCTTCSLSAFSYVLRCDTTHCPTVLGNQIHMTLKQIHEVRIRISQAKAAYSKHRRQIYQNLRIQQSTRVRLLQTMVLSILNYNMGMWRPLTLKVWTMYEGAIMFFYRSVLRATTKHEDLMTWPRRFLLLSKSPQPGISWPQQGCDI